jgi:hypothetical protein
MPSTQIKIDVGHHMRFFVQACTNTVQIPEEMDDDTILEYYWGSLNSRVASEGGCGTEWPGFNSRWEWVFFSAHPSFPHSTTIAGIQQPLLAGGSMVGRLSHS